MSDSEAFEIRDLIRKVVAESNETEPRRIAELVFNAIEEDDYEAALIAVLPTYITVTLSQMRMAMRRAPAVRAVVLHERPGAAVQGRPVARSHDGHPVASRRVAAVREDAWRRRLRENIWVGAEERSRKFLADCTLADLEKAIGLREVIAVRNAAAAAEYRRLRDALAEDETAKVVADLPDDVLAEILDHDEAAA